MFERDDCLVAGALSRPSSHGEVLGVIFAGGASRRYGQDKGLAILDGVPLLKRMVDRFEPQLDGLAISGKRRREFSILHIPDRLPGAGPLGALCQVLGLAGESGWKQVATVSCDTPFIPADFVNRLHAALGNHDCVLASWKGVRHPTCALWTTAAVKGLNAAFTAGVRSLSGAIANLDAIDVDFSDIKNGPGDDPFFNINSPKDMEIAQAWMTAERGPR